MTFEGTRRSLSRWPLLTPGTAHRVLYVQPSFEHPLFRVSSMDNLAKNNMDNQRSFCFELSTALLVQRNCFIFSFRYQSYNLRLTRDHCYCACTYNNLVKNSMPMTLCLLRPGVRSEVFIAKGESSEQPVRPCPKNCLKRESWVLPRPKPPPTLDRASKHSELLWLLRILILCTHSGHDCSPKVMK